MKIGKLIETLSQYDPNTEIWANWITPDEIADRINDSGYEDDEGNLIEADEESLPHEVVTSVFTAIDNEEYIWERFNEAFAEIVANVFSDYLTEKQQAKEDTSLWDKE